MRYACRIEYATSSGGFAGTDGEGRPWRLSREELTQAIVSGRMTCYVTLDGHSHLVTVKDQSLVTFMGALDELALPGSP
jgi:hypothetical protein